MINKDIAKIFYEIADLLEMMNVQWEPRAYTNAAETIEEMTESLEDIYKEKGIEGLMEIKGVGKGIAAAIVEHIETGKIKKYEELRKKAPKDFFTMLRIEGLGPKKIAALHQKLRINTIADLEKAAKEHKISKLEGFKEKTENTILKGIETVKHSPNRMLLNIAYNLANEFVNALSKVKAVEKVTYAGSLRRMKETIGDIDLLVVSRKPKEVMDFFVKMQQVKKVLASGETKTSVVLKQGMQVDLRVLKPESYGAALQYFTGSQAHNIEIRKIAISQGYKLNEYGLFDKKGKMVAGKTEEEIYKVLGLPCPPPEMRENNGELALKKIPQLVDVKDLKGDFHMHTAYSDGFNSVAEMVKAAESLGYEYIAITDHSKSQYVANGMDESAILKRHKEIEKSRENSKIRILEGAEVDILADGKMDYSDNILKKLDLVVGSVHASFRQSKEVTTKRLIAAMENGHVNIIGHLSARKIMDREPIDFDVDAVFKAAKKNDVALEINSQPQRLDLNDVLIRKAREMGVKMVINTDAHSTKQLDFRMFGVAMARRGWCTADDIVNTKKFPEMKKELKIRNH